MQIPVYLFTGFLEAGKTRLIQESMRDPKFNAGENTLILLCEEGVEEYDVDSYPCKNIFIQTVNDESDLNPKFFEEICDQYDFERVIVEYNGMWSIDTLYRNMPEEWLVYQEVLLFDSTSFEIYNQNMRQLVVDKLTSAELVVFNRVNEGTDKMKLHKTVRGTNTQSAIVYEYIDGSVENDTIEDPLPFDIEAEIIDIADKDYAIWYRDLCEHRERYEGKTVRFKGIIAKDPQKKSKISVIGRHVMTCCADDIAYNGLVFKSDNEGDFSTRDWAIIEGRIKSELSPVYGGEGPVIYADSVESAEKPLSEVATFY